MSTYIIRIWLPDRPGALGAVASRIGAVRGDVIGIDIIDSGGGRAIDELTVTLENDALLDLLLAEISEVDEIDIEDVRQLATCPVDPVLTSLEIARELTRQADSNSVLASGNTVDRIAALFRATWVAVIDTAMTGDFVGDAVLTSSGADVPSPEWLVAFTCGASMADEPLQLGDIAVSSIANTTYAIVLGRDQLPLRGREQTQLDALSALIGDCISASKPRHSTNMALVNSSAVSEQQHRVGVR